MRIVSAFAAVLLAACAGSGGESNDWVELKPEPGGAGDSVHITGTVRHLDLEGGLFVIEDAAGTRYNPMNLPDEYQVEGKAVEADARRRDDVMSIGMVGPMVELLRIRAGAAVQTSVASLPGTSWRLETLAGSAVLDEVQATLEFDDQGRAAGSASCNRFTGPVTISGSSLTFGPQAVTRKACPEPIMNQESAYLEAMRAAERFEIEGSTLRIYVAGREQPLRFTRR